ncbi:hypothetical protein [Methanosarcina siciliae]|nr:hypothetical protein [Methanosarcina siciliae]
MNEGNKKGYETEFIIRFSIKNKIRSLFRESATHLIFSGFQAPET